jgi:hypothetical protein
MRKGAKMPERTEIEQFPHTALIAHYDGLAGRKE